MTTDSNLLREYVENDSERAFSELVDRHVDFVYASALRQLGGDMHRAKDITQCVFADLARKAATLAHRASLVGWLHISVHHAAAQLRRSEQRRKNRERDAHTMESDLSTTEVEGDWARLRPVLDSAINELSDTDREVVLLRFFEQRAFGEIGAILQVGEDGARKRVTRALDRLHGSLVKRGITSTTAALGVLLANQTAVAAPAGFAGVVTSAAMTAGAAGSGVGVTVGVLKIMSISKIATITTAAVLLVVGSLVYQSRVKGELDAAMMAAAKEKDELRARLWSAEQKLKQAEHQAATALTSRSETPSNPTSVPTAPGSPKTSDSQLDYILDHPETHAAYVQQEVLRARARFDRFFREANVSPEKQTAFLRQIQAQAESRLDLMIAARSQGFGPTSPPQDPQTALQLATLEKKAAASLQEGMRAELGNDLYKQYGEFAATISERNVVEDLAGRLNFSDAALTRDQADQLVRILTENRFSRQSNEMGGAPISVQVYTSARVQSTLQGSPLDWRAAITDGALARASGVLSSAQTAILQQMQAQQLAQFKIAPVVLRTPSPPRTGGGK